MTFNITITRSNSYQLKLKYSIIGNSGNLLKNIINMYHIVCKYSDTSANE